MKRTMIGIMSCLVICSLALPGCGKKEDEKAAEQSVQEHSANKIKSEK